MRLFTAVRVGVTLATTRPYTSDDMKSQLSVSWIKRRRLIVLTFVAILLLAVPQRDHYSTVDVGPRAASARRDDAAFARGNLPQQQHDDWSYEASARHPFGPGYLERREPYLSRIVHPSAVYLLQHAGVPIDYGFLVVSAIALFSAALALRAIAVTLGVRDCLADLGGAIFLLTPVGVNALLHPAYVDAGSWAIVLWAWHAADARRHAAAVSLLALGLMWRETVLAVMPALLLGARNRRAWVTGIIAVTLACTAAPHLLLGASFSPTAAGIFRSFEFGLSVKIHSPAVTFGVVLEGLSVALLLAPFGLRTLARRNPGRLTGLYVMAGLTIAAGLLSGDGARLMFPAAALVIPAGMTALQVEFQRDVWLSSILFAGAIASCAGWVFGSGSLVAYSLLVAALGVRLVIRRQSPRRLRHGSSARPF